MKVAMYKWNKVRVIAETTDGRCVVRRFTLWKNVNQEPCISYENIFLVPKDDLTEIRNEEIPGEEK